mgnify:CR=1 FL=1
MSTVEFRIERMNEEQIRELLDRVRSVRPEALTGLESAGSLALRIRGPDGVKVFLIQRGPDNRLFGVEAVPISL